MARWQLNSNMTLRAVHPCFVEYMRTMGVRASLVPSLPPPFASESCSVMGEASAAWRGLVSLSTELDPSERGDARQRDSEQVLTAQEGGR